MRTALLPLIALLAAANLAVFGCHDPHGKPGPEPEVPRPDQVLDFATLYKQNCVACHGDHRELGAAISLTNPAYLAVAGEANIKAVLVHGVPGKLMPAFARSGGGMLTDRQVEILAHGLVTTWSKPELFAGKTVPPYKAVSQGDPVAGQNAFLNSCAECHGASGEGTSEAVKGAIVDPAFLALISDQNLRSFVIAGIPELMPDWTSHGGDRPLSDREITDIVAWISSHRASTMAQPGPASSGPAAKTSAEQTKPVSKPQESPR